MIVFIRLLSTLGVIVFTGLILLLLQNPKTLERSAVDFVQTQIETELRERFPVLQQDTMTRGLEMLSQQLGIRQDSIQKQIDSPWPEYVASVVNAYCGCRENPQADIAQRAQAIRDAMSARIEQLGFAQEQLADIVRGQYDRIIAALRHDLMIFLGTNLAAFVSVLGATFTPVERRPYVIYPAIILIVSVAISSGLYLFNTNWFYAILFQDYVGYAYGLGMLAIFALLCDILLNRARICLRIVANLPSALVPPGC